MRKLPLSRFLLAGAIFLASLSAAWAASASSIIPNGDDTYTVKREARTTFDRDLDRLKSEAVNDANQYATSKGMEAKVISVSTKKPWYLVGFPSATVIFRLYKPGDPLLTAPVSSSANSASAAPAPTYAPPPIGTDELYKDLLKLDELRKKGILTDQEFEQEKKKLLDRSR